MKHLISTLTAFALMASPALLASTASNSSKLDTVTITDNNGQHVTLTVNDSTASATIISSSDTISALSLSFKSAVNEIASRVNDTLAAYNSSATIDTHDNAAYAPYEDMSESTVAIFSVITVFSSIVIIVLAILAVYFFNRRNKYRIIEKAIENNYTLPDGFIKKSYSQSPAPQDQPRSHNMSYLDEAEMRKGIQLAIVGLGIILFFWFLDIDFLAALAVIPMLIGTSKILITYFKNKNNRIDTPQPDGGDAHQPTPPVFKHNDNSDNAE